MVWHAAQVRRRRWRFVAATLTLLAASGAWPVRAQDPSPQSALLPAAAQQAIAAGGRSDPAAPATDDPGATKAAAVLATHCARCHQEGKLTGLLPSGAIGNITRLGEIAREPGLVEPQFPDASRIYLEMVERRMPLDAYHEGTRAAEPSDEEIQAVRDWIAGLPPRADTCPGRPFIAPEAVQTVIRAALESDPAGARTTRFITLTHLHNACVPEAELAGLRQAAAKLMNSLAWNLEPARLEPIDEAKTILRLRLPDLGWVGAHWEKLARTFPYASAPALAVPADIAEHAGTRIPALPADWVASAALRPELYADLLGLPAELDDLKRILNLDTDQSVKSGKAVRAAVSASALTRAHRLIDVHPLATGGSFWLAYDFAGTTGDRDIFQRPLGPAGAQGVANPFRHDAVRVMFNLPNGFLAHAVHDADGRRLEQVPHALERAEAVGHGASVAGASCIACHTGGPVAVKDELRKRLQADGTPQARAVRDALQDLLRGESELQTLFEDEAYRFRRAMIRANVDPDLLIGGLEPVAALKQRYDRDVSPARAAAEFGIEAAAFRALLDRHTGTARELALRLRQGRLKRVDIAPLFAALAGPPPAAAESVAAPAPAGDAAGSGKSQPRERVELVVLADRSAYKAGDLVTFSARASGECRLTLISVNRAGKAIVLFPNEFEQDNLLAPGREIRVPGARAPYQLRLKEPGTETLIGVCTRNAKVADGIQPDYEKQRFTILGDWRNFLRTALEEEAAERLAPEKPDAKRRKKARGKPEAGEAQSTGRPEMQTRTAIRYVVE